MTNSDNYSTLRDHIDLVRRQLLAECIRYLDGLDASVAADWATIVKTAREAGLGKDTLCHELSCAWSTILRWEAGQTVPGPSARRAIKARLMRLLKTAPAERKGVIAA